MRTFQRAKLEFKKISFISFVRKLKISHSHAPELAEGFLEKKSKFLIFRIQSIFNTPFLQIRIFAKYWDWEND